MLIPTNSEPLKAPGLDTETTTLATGNSFRISFAICSASLSTRFHFDLFTKEVILFPTFL